MVSLTSFKIAALASFILLASGSCNLCRASDDAKQLHKLAQVAGNNFRTDNETAPGMDKDRGNKVEETLMKK